MVRVPRTFTAQSYRHKRPKRLLSTTQTSINSISQGITFTQTISSILINRLNKQITDKISFLQTVNTNKRSSTPTHSHFQCPEDNLYFVESISYTKQPTKTFHISDKINFFQCIDYDATHYPIVYYLNVNQLITFKEHITGTDRVANSISTGQVLVFHEDINHSKGGVTSSLNTDTLTFSQTLSFGKIINKFVSQSITFNQTINNHHLINKKLRDKLIFNESITTSISTNHVITDQLIFLDYIPRILNAGTIIQQPILQYVVIRDACNC